MAGSGKTTLIQRINAHLHAKQQPGYIINLDPAVSHLPYGANIDIRDTVGTRRPPAAPLAPSQAPLTGLWGLAPQVKYKEVMKQYGLGPNGGILTSCNLFATRFDQVCVCVGGGGACRPAASRCQARLCCPGPRGPSRPWPGSNWGSQGRQGGPR